MLRSAYASPELNHRPGARSADRAGLSEAVAVRLASYSIGALKRSSCTRGRASASPPKPRGKTAGSKTKPACVLRSCSIL